MEPPLDPTARKSETPSRRLEEGSNGLIARFVRVGNWAVTHPLVLVKPVRYLFIISHMRSRSTLLSHVLGSHPEISGYVETHIRYRGALDFLRLRRRVSVATGRKVLTRYVMDKLVASDCIDSALIDKMGISPIFLVRKPEDSIRSTCTMMQPRNPQKYLDKSFKYYVQRVRWLEHCCATLSTKGIFIESASLISRTAEVFQLIQEQLKLSVPLTESYQVFRETGQAVMGDPSKMIKEGQIIRDGRKSYEGEFVVPPEMLAEARAAYESCVAVLSQRCWHLS